ncbi:secretin receptor isoform X2 [Gouania willdenowi]|uniref:secretin receptor isoform X2 n=1 Tax=Gouania willdenowi TaxID=441366 RepID=UPI001056341D|nr:secretin receptor-like isoform X2 [Gouania willdenowi]
MMLHFHRPGGPSLNMLHVVGLIGLCFIPVAKTFHHCHPHVKFMEDEEKCMKDVILKSHKAKETNVSVHCRGMWDELNCWPPSVVGETVSQPCPDLFDSDGVVHRNCSVSGWTELLVPHEDACGSAFNDTLHFLGESSDSHLYFSYVRAMYTAGHTLSLVGLVLAITVFSLFRKLRCTRTSIHMQLFLSFILRGVSIMVRDALLFADEALYHCDAFPAACKVVLTFSNYSILVNYSWLLVEGHFLSTLVRCSSFSLRKHFTWYLVLSWGLPLVVVSSWGCAKFLYEDEGCWETRRQEWIWWILRAPVLLTIAINLIFFLIIMKILVSKLRLPDAQRNEFCQYKRLIRSTFSLVALLGLHYIIFVFVPVNASSSVFQMWTLAELALSSTQGFVVATLYCFLNAEVQNELLRRWRRWRLSRLRPSPQQQLRGSISHSASPHTQVSLLACTPGNPSTPGNPAQR